MSQDYVTDMRNVLTADMVDRIRRGDLRRFRDANPGPVAAQFAITNVRPRGAWVTNANAAAYGKYHRIEKAQAIWAPDRVICRVDAHCGATFWVPRLHVEPPDDYFDLCDACVFAGEEMHHVYRMFGPGDELLYVGYSAFLFRRLGWHRNNSKWWPLVRRCSYVQFPDEKSAKEAEVVAQVLEGPTWNFPKGVRPRLRHVLLPLTAAGHCCTRGANGSPTH